MQNFDENHNPIPRMFDEQLKNLEATLTDKKVSDLQKSKAVFEHLENGFSPSLRKLIQELEPDGIKQVTVSQLLLLAKMPPAALACFRPEAVKCKWVEKLSRALTRDPDLFLAKVQELKTAPVSDFKKFKVLAALA